MQVIGRNYEIGVLQSLLATPKAELVAVYGRRRVGKTFLIRNVCQQRLRFDFTGTQNASLANQLFKFSEKIASYFPDQAHSTKPPKNWAEAFALLRICLQQTQAEKPVVFFDEVPWIATRRSNFLEEFAYWWNDWASLQNIVVVICGSAASWMLNKVIDHKGGLHNRVTKRINLKPFTLAETKRYLEHRGVYWDYYQVIQLYMAVGGIPTYLSEVTPGETVTQTINRLFFGNEGFLRNEFQNLYAALFDSYEQHVAVIRALAGTWRGMTRTELIEATSLTDGGGFSQIINELETSSFIARTLPLGKKQKDALFRLTDEYSLFYLKFVDRKTAFSPQAWLTLATADAYRVWCGYAFESLCLKHIESIKTGLGISGIYTEVASYRFRGTLAEPGFQIDLLIERADNAINLCEMKFANDDFVLTNDYADTLRRRREAFRRVSETKKLLFNTLITTYGVRHSPSSMAQVDQVLTMDKLFLQETF